MRLWSGLIVVDNSRSKNWLSLMESSQAAERKKKIKKDRRKEKLAIFSPLTSDFSENSTTYLAKTATPYQPLLHQANPFLTKNPVLPT